MAILPGGLHSHTTLETTDIAKALRFYHEVLGLSTAQQLFKVGLLRATNDHIAAIIQMPKISPQPYWNYYARPVPLADVDALHAKVMAVADDYELQSVTDPFVETRFGIGTYGFTISDRDGNRWRIEDQDGPFGRVEIPQLEATSIIPPGPIHYVTLEAGNIERTAAFYREFLGLSIDLRNGAIYSAAPGAVHLIAVPADDTITPQPVLNHHGISLDESARLDIDRAFTLATEQQDVWGILKINQITEQHGSYQFYFQDADTNWWEIEALDAGLNPWQRVNQPPGSSHLLHPEHGSNTVKHPWRAARA